MLTGVTHIIWLCSTSSNAQVVRNYSPQSGGDGGDFDFLVAGPWYDPVLKAHLPNWASLQTTGGHDLFRLYAQGNVEDFDFFSAFPNSNKQTVGAASWQNHDSPPPPPPPPPPPRSLLLYCTAMVAYVNQTPTFPPHYGDNIKVKAQHICQANPALLRGSGEVVVTNEWCIIYSL